MRRRVKQSDMRARSSKRSVIIVFNLILFCLLAAANYAVYREDLETTFKKKETDQKIENIRIAAFEVLDEYGFKREQFAIENGWLHIDVPTDLSITRLYYDIVTRTRPYEARVLQGNEDLASGLVRLVLGYKNRAAIRLKFEENEEASHNIGYMAIIIDDFGYSTGDVYKRLIELPYDVTISVIPGLQRSREIAQIANNYGKEVMVHYPMEAEQEKVEDNGYTLFTYQSQLGMRRRIRGALRSIPFAKGANNHQGSKATADRKTMDVLMNELARKKFYFVDSRTTNKSVAVDAALAAKVPVLYNDMFLDNDPELEAIKKQLGNINSIIQRKGRAVIIGHARETTFKALEEELPKLDKLGYKVVSVSTLIQKISN